MEEEKVAGQLIDRHSVDEVRAEAVPVIKAFLQEVMEAVRTEAVPASSLVPTIEGAELAFSIKFRGHEVRVRTINSRPGEPLGSRVGMNVAIDGVDIDGDVSGDFDSEIRRYLGSKFSDFTALFKASRLKTLAQRLKA